MTERCAFCGARPYDLPWPICRETCECDLGPGDGVALRSAEHPPGAIERIADAIRSGKLSTKRGPNADTERT